MPKRKREVVPPPDVGRKISPSEAQNMLKDLPAESCRTCRFHMNGWCRRYPQSVTKSPDYWCGEYILRGIKK